MTSHRNALGAGARVERYEIETVIGHGGFGISYCAIDVETRERVALKEFLPTELATREADDSIYPLSEAHVDDFRWGLERFLDEVNLLARFRHPSIVRVLRAFEGNGTAYMVMVYEEGESLATRLSREGTLDPDATMALVMALLDGLEIVHDAGFIHRDIKPSNIYLRDDGSPVLLDFGSARQALRGKTRTLTALVSAGYAPLEQYFSRSDLQGPWSDIYSLGATLYEAITGAPPIDAVERSRGVLGSTRDILPPAAEIAPAAYPAALLAAVDHALRMEDQERPRSVAEWRRELTGRTPIPEPPQTILVTPRTTGRPDTVTRPASRSATSPRLHPRLAILSTMLLLAVGSFMWWQLASFSTALEERIADPRPRVETRAPESGLATLRESLSAANAAAESARGEIDALTRRLMALEAERRADRDRSPIEAPRAPPDENRLREQDSIIAELRGALDDAKRQGDEARQRAEELAARVKLLEAVQAREDAAAVDRQGEIDRLLAAADADLRRLRLTTPAGANAHERYRRVLELDEENTRARRGLGRIVEKYIELAELARARGDEAAATRYLERAAHVLPDHAGLASFGPGDPTATVRPPSAAPAGDTLHDNPTPGPSTQTNEGTPPGKRPVRIAMLQFARRQSSRLYFSETLSSELTAAIHSQDGLRLVYSYYDPSRIGEPATDTEIWTGGPVSFRIDEERAVAVGKRLNADMIVTAQNPIAYMGQWGEIHDESEHDAEIYLLDVLRGTLHQDRVKIRHAGQSLTRLVARARSTDASPEPPVADQGSTPDAGRIASPRVVIFPTSAAGWSTFNEFIVPDITRQLTRYIASHTDLALAYSFYAESAPGNSVSQNYWQGPKALKNPDVAAIVSATRELGGDTAIAVFHWNMDNTTSNIRVTQARLYVIDAMSGEVFMRAGNGAELAELADAAFSEFNASRRASSRAASAGTVN